jgi:hypothetical protein
MRNHPWLLEDCEIIPELKEIKEEILEEERQRELELDAVPPKAEL